MNATSLTEQPLLTIVICTYNAEIHLAECIATIAPQKTSHIKLHIIDGNSTDSTLSIIKSNSSVVDYWRSEKDSGVYDAMNKSLTNIESGWVLYLGADDRLMPNIASRLIKILQTQPAETTVYYGDVYRPASNTIYDGKFSKIKMMRRNICQQAILYPRAALSKYNFDTTFPINADHILNINLFFDSSIRKEYIPICISYYEDILEGISRDRFDIKLLSKRKQLALENHQYLPWAIACIIDTKEWIKKKFKKK